MNNNGARNHALNYGRKRAKWTFVLDGFCMFNDDLWENTIKNINDNTKLIIIDMIRLTDNKVYNENIDYFESFEKHEPQVAFYHSSKIKFNENYVYGRLPKVELLKYIKLNGKWDNWNLLPIEKNFYSQRESIDINYEKKGLIMRLRTAPEESLNQSSRTEKRTEGINIFLLNLDKQTNWKNYNPNSLILYNYNNLIEHKQVSSIINKNKIKIVNQAEIVINISSHSVIDKINSAPNNDKHEYLSVAPYFHKLPPGVIDPIYGTYQIKDCKRNESAILYSTKSLEESDRTALQYMIDHTTCLSLAYTITNKRKFALKAYKNIKVWFLDKNTKMNPNMEYSQMYGYLATGLIDFKDMYYLIDSIKLIYKFFSDNEIKNLKKWFSDLLNWLTHSNHGKKESTRPNNHLTSLLILKFSIAFFIKDYNEMLRIKTILPNLIDTQIDSYGHQIYEKTRPDTFHYYLFNLQLLITLVKLVYRVFPERHLIHNKKFKKAIEYMLPFYKSKKWELQQLTKVSEREYTTRLLPIIFTYNEWYVCNDDKKIHIQENEILKNFIYHPNEGITLYWILTY